MNWKRRRAAHCRSLPRSWATAISRRYAAIFNNNPASAAHARNSGRKAGKSVRTHTFNASVSPGDRDGVLQLAPAGVLMYAMTALREGIRLPKSLSLGYGIGRLYRDVPQSDRRLFADVAFIRQINGGPANAFSPQ